MGPNPANFRKSPQNPVEVVSWDDAQEFCKKLSATSGKTVRLPTEAEWEYACRAGTTTAYYFGDDDKDLAGYAWFGDKPTVAGCQPANSNGVSHPVGEKKPNAWGLYDLYGNVWEWCQDWYGPYQAGAVTDPQGPAQGTERVVRGGAWYDNSITCRSAFRHHYIPTRRGGNLGFRVVVGAAATAP
jgi:formylglycine-generating enzyme required for sulfatase activity